MIQRVGFIGYGYVGRGTASAIESVAEVRWHDPAHAGSLPFGELVRWADALFVCVPTPVGVGGFADLRIVREVASALADLSVDVPVLLKSTVPPGTTADLTRQWPSLPMVFTPEFLRERHHLEDAARPARVVLGWSSSISELHQARVRALYNRRFPHTPRVELDATEAELLKYASNALFGVKVSFANEMAEFAGRLGVSWECVRQALVLDPRVGDGHLSVPGPDGQPGFGGSCLPKDMAALLAMASTLGLDLDVVAAAVRANQRRRA
jgi:UDPglucose 6-dehydrogenase